MIPSKTVASSEDSTPIVYIVDDDAPGREALEIMIRSAGWEPRSFGSGREFLACLRAMTPGCLILGTTLPDFDSLELQKLLSDRSEMPVIFVTDHSDVATTVRAMKAGAFEFMTKPFRNDLMLSAIGSAIERSRLAIAKEADLQRLRGRYASLSCRERQVMELVVRGLLNKRIGGQLGITEATVKAHRGKVMRKIKARTVAELISIATRMALIPEVPAEIRADRALSNQPIYASRPTERGAVFGSAG